MFRKTNLPKFLTLSFCLLSIQLVSADIVIDSYSDNTNDRFSNSTSFIANSYNLSGVGQSDGATRWATAVSRNTVISAWHWRPRLGSTVYFYPDNNPDSLPVTRQITSQFKIPGTDLFLGTLDSNLPGSIKHYDFAAEALSGTPPSMPDEVNIENAGSLTDLTAVMVGLSPFDVTSSTIDNRLTYNDQAYGFNKITGYAENVDFGGNADNDSLILLHDGSADPNFLQYESRLRGGDSGAPAFVDIGGQLVLLGTNAFILTPNDVGSGLNYTGNQALAINSFISANAVPEPGSAMLLLAAMGVTAMRRRRSQVSHEIVR